MKTECPNCGVTWEGEEIPVALMATGIYTSYQDAETAAGNYGWTPENNRTFNVNVIFVNTLKSQHYWHCLACNTCFDCCTWEVINGIST